jgi:hypothetical protein
MAIIDCPECKKPVSDVAPACPLCGAPVAQLVAGKPAQAAAAHAAPAQAERAASPQKRRTAPWAWVMVGVLATLGLVFFVMDKGQEQQQRAEQRKPDMPLKVGYRKAVLGPGLVLLMENRSERHLAVVLTVGNPTTKQIKSFRVDVSPKQTAEVGHLEGWTFASGDSLKIAHTDYRTWQGSLP